MSGLPTPPVITEPVANVPDPTLATISLLYREIESVTVARQHEIKAVIDVFNAKLDGYDRAIALLHDDVTGTPSDVDRAVKNLRELLMAIMEERSEKVEGQFEERDVRQRENAAQNKLAIDAALQAQKEAAAEGSKNFEKAIDKSESAFAKQIEDLGRRLTIAIEGLDRRINDLKESVTRLEATGLGRAQQVVETRAQNVDLRGTITVAIGMLSLAIAIAGLAIGLALR